MKKLAICQSCTKSSEMDGYSFEFAGISVVDSTNKEYPTWTDEEIDDAVGTYNELKALVVKYDCPTAFERATDMCWDNLESTSQLRVLVNRIEMAKDCASPNWQIICEIIRMQTGGYYCVTHIDDDAGNRYTVLYVATIYDESTVTGDFANQIFDREVYYEAAVYDVEDLTVAAINDRKFCTSINVKCSADEEHPEMEIMHETGADAVLIDIDGKIVTA